MNKTLNKVRKLSLEQASNILAESKEIMKTDLGTVLMTAVSHPKLGGLIVCSTPEGKCAVVGSKAKLTGYRFK